MRLLLVMLLLITACGTRTGVAQAANAGEISHGSLKTAYGTSFQILTAGNADAPLAVLLVPGKWGLDAELQAWLPALAGQGVRVVAMDLFDGRPVRNEYMANDVWHSVDPVWITADLDGAVADMSRSAKNIVVMGWDDSLPFVQDSLARHQDEIQGLVAVGRQVSVDVPLLLLNKADLSAVTSVQQFLGRWQ